MAKTNLILTIEYFSRGESLLSRQLPGCLFPPGGKGPGEPRQTITPANTEFIRRYLMHVLPPGFQKVRYHGFLNNRYKAQNLKPIFSIQGHRRFKERYANLSMAELLKAAWDVDVHLCPKCGRRNMRHVGRTYGTS